MNPPRECRGVLRGQAKKHCGQLGKKYEPSKEDSKWSLPRKRPEAFLATSPVPILTPRSSWLREWQQQNEMFFGFTFRVSGSKYSLWYQLL